MQNATLKVHDYAQENKIKDVQGGMENVFVHSNDAMTVFPTLVSHD